jgi:serine/threonine-protein kinase
MCRPRLSLRITEELEMTVELDDFKTTWQSFDRRLAAQTAIHVELLREQKLGRARAALRPLATGQTVQIGIGAVLAFWSANFWIDHHANPHLLAAGLILHAYGIAIIVTAVRTLSLVKAIDDAAPVVEIQKRMAALRRWNVRSGLAVGLAWWFVWMPLVMMIIGELGADLYANAPSVIWAGTAIGVAGLWATWVLYRWVRQPGRSKLADAIAESAVGRSIRRAEAAVDEVARFRSEG